MTDTRPVRASENLDWQHLAVYLRNALSLPPAEMQVEQFPGGHSNLTYLIRFAEQEMVLRRAPFGPLPARAHDMARESRLLSAVHPHFPLAPRPLLLCEDASIIGSVFYVMERRRGIIIRTSEPQSIAGNEELRGKISASVVDTLAALHAIDVTKQGLDVLGKPAGFMARQVRGWNERWQAAKTSEVPEMDALARWLEERIPADPGDPALVHGDYKLDNVMLDERSPERVVAVLDWEMSAVGDPLVDLGIILCYWVHVSSSGDDAISGVTAQPGWFGRGQILERYAAQSKRSLDNISLYEVFALFKLAVVVQQIYARYVRGQTDDPRFARMGERVEALARIASLRATVGGTQGHP